MINLIGAAEVRDAFKDLRMYLPKNPIRNAVRQAAKMLHGYIVLLAPKLTGKLARLIKVRVRRTKETIRAHVVVDTVGNEKNPQNAFYWRFLEEGFHTRAGDFKKLPFVITAFNAMKQDAAQLVIDEVDKAIKRAERKAKAATKWFRWSETE